METLFEGQADIFKETTTQPGTHIWTLGSVLGGTLKFGSTMLIVVLMMLYLVSRLFIFPAQWHDLMLLIAATVVGMLSLTTQSIDVKYRTFNWTLTAIFMLLYFLLYYDFLYFFLVNINFYTCSIHSQSFFSSSSSLSFSFSFSCLISFSFAVLAALWALFRALFLSFARIFCWSSNTKYNKLPKMLLWNYRTANTLINFIIVV